MGTGEEEEEEAGEVGGRERSKRNTRFSYICNCNSDNVTTEVLSYWVNIFL